MQRARVVSRRLGLTAFWRWWTGELAPLVPHQLRNTVARMRMRPVLAFDADVAVLLVPQVGNGHLAYEETARIPLAGDPEAAAAAGRAAIDALVAANGGRAGPPRVVVALAADQVLRKTISLPAAVEENLLQVLTYDLDRHTPFKPEEMCFDAAIVGRDPVRKEVRVDWAAALKSVIESVRRRAEAWGATVIAVTPDRPTGGGHPARKPLNLLPAAERPDAAAGRGWEIWVPLCLIAVAALIATALPLWQKRSYAIALQQQAIQQRAQADASTALRDQLERLTGDYNFALSKKYTFPSALQSVEDVTKLLPDDTWLTQLEVKTAKGKEPRRDIVVRGESANAGRLISLFEDSKLFSEAAPRSPTTKIQPGPGEIFDLGAQLKPLPPPAPVQLATLGSADSGAPTAPPSPAPSAAPAATIPPPASVPPAASAPSGASAPPAASSPPAAPATPARSPAPVSTLPPTTPVTRAPVPAAAVPAPSAEPSPPQEEN